MMKKDDWSIPLECVDHHWKKLDILPAPAAEVEGISYQRDMEVLLNWQRHQQPAANGWETPYLERIDEFKKIASPTVATQEIMEL